MVTKKQLREKYKETRLSVGVEEADKDSFKICQRIFRTVDWQKTGRICAYAAISDLKEVDVSSLLDAVRYKYPDKKIKILNQSKIQKIPKTKFDLILVPCLAFDKDNYRLGWGGGFYDRFLAGQPQAFKIGPCFHSGFVKEGLLHEKHDIPLDLIVTES